MEEDKCKKTNFSIRWWTELTEESKGQISWILKKIP